MGPLMVMGGLSLASMAIGRSDAKKALKLQEQMLKLQRDQLTFAQERYTKNEELYGQTRRDLVDMANEGVKADLQGVTDRASADVARSFDKSRQETDRNLARYGINPNSGRAMAVRSGDGITKAAVEAGLINTARRDEQRYADTETWNRRNAVARLGAQELQFDASNVSNAGAQLAAGYGQMADGYRQSSQAAYGLAGNIAGIGLSYYLSNPKPAPSATPATSNMLFMRSAQNPTPAAYGLSTSYSPYLNGISDPYTWMRQ